MGIKTRMPLVCQAGPAAEAFVGSLPLVKNMSSIKDFPVNVNENSSASTHLRTSMTKTGKGQKHRTDAKRGASDQNQ
jgi:hypothetical protein